MPKFIYSQIELENMSNNKWLSDRERKVFDLFYARGWAIEDIAAELDFNRSTINRILKSIRLKTTNHKTMIYK